MRFYIGELDLEDCAPRHFCDPSCHHFGSERDILFSNVVTPLGSTTSGRHRLVGRCVQKWICRVSPIRGSTSSSSLPPFAAKSSDYVSEAGVDSARSNFLICQL